MMAQKLNHSMSNKWGVLRAESTFLKIASLNLLWRKATVSESLLNISLLLLHYRAAHSKLPGHPELGLTLGIKPTAKRVKDRVLSDLGFWDKSVS
ncbi:hypothetical protein JOM56_005017 [Amanita muscaria]